MNNAHGIAISPYLNTVHEKRLLAGLDTRLATLTVRVTQAMQAGRHDLAAQAAKAIAAMENERAVRQAALDCLDQQIVRLRSSLEQGHRRVIDLEQGAITARAIRREQAIRSRMHTSGNTTSSADEAQDLIAHIIGKDHPFENSQILSEINADLSHSDLDDRMANQGFGPPTRVTAHDVLTRLKTD